jgi:hypothetical protein
MLFDGGVVLAIWAVTLFMLLFEWLTTGLSAAWVFNLCSRQQGDQEIWHTLLPIRRYSTIPNETGQLDPLPPRIERRRQLMESAEIAAAVRVVEPWTREAIRHRTSSHEEAQTGAVSCPFSARTLLLRSLAAHSWPFFLIPALPCSSPRPWQQ